MRVLVVEDNKTLLESVVNELKKSFDVEYCQDGEEAIYMINQNIYDIVVLDLMLPNISGIEILKNMRINNIYTPVIILTAKESLDEKVQAFEIGANDYLTKPFYMEELIARIYAILRTTGKLEDKNKISFKELYIDVKSKKVFIKNDQIDFQYKQLKLLEYFLINKGSILLKEQIYDRIWGMDSDVTIEIVEVYVSKLRKKLSEYGYDKYIKTKRKVGYTFDDK